MSAASMKEGKVRVAAALARLGILDLPIQPWPSHEPAHDLILAVRTLRTAGMLPPCDLALLGELAFTGEVRPIRGLLPTLLEYRQAAIVPASQVGEAQHASRATGLPVYLAGHLADVIEHISGRRELPPATGPEWAPGEPPTAANRADLTDDQWTMANRCAALPRSLVVRPPGWGRILVARAAHALLPTWTLPEALAASCQHSRAGLAPDYGVLRSRPFRAPHHSVSEAAMKGTPGRPGEVQLANHGMLLLDEVSEFRRPVLEATRDALRDYPCRVVAMADPCPCGYLGSGRRQCLCPPDAVRRHRDRLDTIKGILDLTEA